MTKLQPFVAFLRGINVGGNPLVSMSNLKQEFEDLGFTNIKTVLNSGNVVFETSPEPIETLVSKIEEGLKQVFGFEIKVLLRTGDEIQNLIKQEPFKNTVVTPDTRLNVTFLPEGIQAAAFKSSDDNFQIVLATDQEICWSVNLSLGHGTPEVMKAFEKQFGNQITTRTWNTLLKIGQLVAA